MDNKLLHLTEENYIGKGLHRKCYLHPEDQSKCIKINYNDGAETETNREVSYYQHLVKRNISWEALAHYYGTVQTDLGTGYIFELIRDYDGNIAKSLEEYLVNEALSQEYHDSLVQAFKQLKSNLLTNRIITMTIKSKNILLQRQSHDKQRLIIIDNIGNSTFLPIASYCNWAAKTKIERTWQRFLDAIVKENRHNPLIKQLVEETKH